MVNFEKLKREIKPTKAFIAIFGVLLIVTGYFKFGLEFTNNTYNPIDLIQQNIPPAIGWIFLLAGSIILFWAIANRKR